MNNPTRSNSVPAPLELRQPAPNSLELRRMEEARFPFAPWLAALLGWTLILGFYDLGGGAAFEPIDAWVGQTAREMLASGDWLVPRFSGEIRLNKSPGAYWAVMLTSCAFSRPVDEFCTRFPGGVAGVVMTFAIVWLACRTVGRRAAIYAGFAAASSIFFLSWTHRGSSDFGLAAICALSLAAFWEGTLHPHTLKRGLFWMLAYLLAGVGMLYKMPMPLIGVGLPAVLFALLRGRWRVLFSPWHLLGIVLFAAVWAPWAYLMMGESAGSLDRWRIEFIDRFLGEAPNVQGVDPVKEFLVNLLVPLAFTFPFLLSIPAAVFRTLRERTSVSADAAFFLLIWPIAVYGVLLASSGKEVRYFLPALPPIFVMLGLELAVVFDHRIRELFDANRAAIVAIWLLGPIAMASGVWALLKNLAEDDSIGVRELAPWIIAVAALFGLGIVVSAALYWTCRRGSAFGCLVATMWLVFIVAWPTLMPRLITADHARELAGDLLKLTKEEQAVLRFVGSQDPRVIWYGGIPIPRLVGQEEMQSLLAGRRALDEEERIYAARMIEKLLGDAPILLVIREPDFERFLRLAVNRDPRKEAILGHLNVWIHSGAADRKSRQFLVLGNRPPSWPPPLDVSALLAADAE